MFEARYSNPPTTSLFLVPRSISKRLREHPHFHSAPITAALASSQPQPADDSPACGALVASKRRRSTGRRLPDRLIAEGPDMLSALLGGYLTAYPPPPLPPATAAPSSPSARLPAPFPARLRHASLLTARGGGGGRAERVSRRGGRRRVRSGAAGGRVPELDGERRGGRLRPRPRNRRYYGGLLRRPQEGPNSRGLPCLLFFVLTNERLSSSYSRLHNLVFASRPVLSCRWRIG